MNCENFVQFVKNFNLFDFAKENFPEKTLSFYGGGFKDDTASNFRSSTMYGIKNAKVFEVEDGIKKLLALTDTPINDTEIHLPFPVIFIDVAFTREELESYGLEVKSEKVVGLLIREGIMQSSEDIIVGKDLNITTLSKVGDEIWFDCFNKNIVITDKEKENWEVKVAENPTTCKVTREFLHRFVINFLNFLNNPEVEYVEHKRSEKNIERKIREGKTPTPSSLTIREGAYPLSYIYFKHGRK